LNAVEKLAAGYGSSCDSVRQELTIAENQLRDYRARLGLPFTHDAYLAELTALRDQRRDGLSGIPAESGAEQASVPDLAERIRALKAANSIEVAPERAGKRRAAAECVTARLRRPEPVQDAAAPIETASQAPAANGTHASRILAEEAQPWAERPKQLCLF
jgi:hypothetical protein